MNSKDMENPFEFTYLEQKATMCSLIIRELMSGTCGYGDNKIMCREEQGLHILIGKITS